VLWLIVAVTVVVGVTEVAVRVGSQASSNRIWLTRAEWAREGCVEILISRYADAVARQGPTPTGVDSIDLGRGSWCRAKLTDPASRLNLNQADAASLRIVLGSDSLTDAVLDWRDPDDLARERGAERDWYSRRHRPTPRNGPFADVRELHLVRGFEDADEDRLVARFTVDGQGLINLNNAPTEVLASLPGMTEEGLQVLAFAQRSGKRWTSLDEWVASVSPASRRSLMGTYAELQSRVTVAPVSFLAFVEGGIRGTPIVARERLTVVPAGSRLAVVMRQAE
jgi:type II secretory pathway component PulK